MNQFLAVVDSGTNDTLFTIVLILAALALLLFILRR